MKSKIEEIESLYNKPNLKRSGLSSISLFFFFVAFSTCLPHILWDEEDNDDDKPNNLINSSIRKVVLIDKFWAYN